MTRYIVNGLYSRANESTGRPSWNH